MTLRLQQVIDIAESLSLAEKLELLKQLSILIQEAHTLNQTKNQTTPDDDTDEIGFSSESFKRSWEQAVTGKTLPASVLWEDNDIE
ncbi:MAG: hypothetical protein NW220_12525 [Leptolyngbyaceae cyanobacterium bins.349]|nr:hypothetical protein [Leptolyngbyaceae cyanobacterium bins.349]